MNSHLTLWIPGLRPASRMLPELRAYLAASKPLPRSKFQNINLILSRADRVAAQQLVDHDFILQQLRDDPGYVNQWPLAQWRLAGEQMPGSHHGIWLCADPVYVHPDRSQALLLAHEELTIQQHEATQLVELINQHFVTEPWQLLIASSHHWYIRLEHHHDMQTSTLQQALGKNIFDFLPRGDDARYWQQVLNEIQMLLHGSEINQQREAEGQLPVNSLWLWGYTHQASNGGTGEKAKTNASANFNWQQVHADDTVLKGLGCLSGSDCTSLPESFSAIKDLNTEVLVFDDNPRALLARDDIPGWLAYLELLENNWFTPLVKHMKQQPDFSLSLLLSSDEAYRCQSKQLKRWWRIASRNSLI